MEAVGCGAGFSWWLCWGCDGLRVDWRWDVPEDVFRVAIVGVDEGFGLRVAVRAVASAVEWDVCGSCADLRTGVQEAYKRLRRHCFHSCCGLQLMREFCNVLVTYLR